MGDKVWSNRVLDREISDIEGKIKPAIDDSIWKLAKTQPAKVRLAATSKLKDLIVDLIRSEDINRHGALKVLHKPDDSRDADLALDRIKREIEAMSESDHPNLLKIRDYDSDGKWFVSEYHTGGILTDNLSKYRGNILNTLKHIRPLVEGVNQLHKHNKVHRDIKPDNIFLNKTGDLILGDFGLIYFSDNNHTRISQTFENVGSRDWMPGWATGIRIEDIKPSSDIYSLGKVIWSMVSGKIFLRFWYFDEKDFNVERQFPSDKNMWRFNQLLKKCIVEREEDCLPNAEAFLEVIDETISYIQLNIDRIDAESNRKCKVCGDGIYRIKSDLNADSARGMGIESRGDIKYKIFACSNCGHIQFFIFGPGNTVPQAWINI